MAKELNVEKEEIAFCLDAIQDPISLQEPVYGDETEKFLKCNHTTLEHVRINRRLYSIQELEKTLVDSGLVYKKSIEDALYVQNSNVIRKLFDKGLVTIQSLTSMECAKSLDVKDGHKVLDVCAAPGGKSEYLSELAKIDLISCDIHDHRLNLIKSYFSRMHTQGCNVVKNNGTILREDYINKFDRVLCDVPCSGLGIIHKKPDILLNLERKDIDLSCCNNFKMGCGEGVCGSCTTRFSGHRVKRFCKVQANPRDMFEGRRFI